MDEQSRASKNRILQKIRLAAETKVKMPYPEVTDDEGIFPELEEYPEVLFAKRFKQIGGNFVYCEHIDELLVSLEQLVALKGWKHLHCWDKKLQDLLLDHDFRYCRPGHNLDRADAGITDCEALVARTGSVLMSSRQASGRTLAIFPPVHIVITTPDKIVYNIQQALNETIERHEALPSMISLVTGNSRTADIEKTLVNGMHGPKEIYVFLVDDLSPRRKVYRREPEPDEPENE